MTSRPESVLTIERPLLVAALLSLAAIVFAGATIDKTLAALASALFAVVAMWTGTRATASLAPLDVLHHTTRLTAVMMAWAGVALLFAYPIAGLKWIHGWEYGLGALLLAFGFGHYARRFQRAEVGKKAPNIEKIRRLAGLQSLALTGALGWLIFSGKLATPKGDWLANDVFLATASAVLVLSVLFIIRGRTAPLG